MWVSCGTARPLAAHVGRAPLRRAAQGPEHRRAEVAVDVAAPTSSAAPRPGRRARRSPSSRVGVLVGRDRPDELAARARAAGALDARASPSNTLQPRFFGGSSGSSSTRLTSSTSSWPTSPTQISPSAGSNEKRHGLRSPLSTTCPARPRRVDVDRQHLAELRCRRSCAELPRVERAAAVAEPEVEPAVGAERELAAVVVLLRLLDVSSSRTGRGAIVRRPPRAVLGDARVAARGRSSADTAAGSRRSPGGRRCRAAPAPCRS